MASERVTNCIRRLRFEHDELTQQRLADLVGCSRQTIIALEAGKYQPSIQLAFKLSRVFRLPIESVFQMPGK
jgi:putative transcriptional regulator